MLLDQMQMPKKMPQPKKMTAKDRLNAFKQSKEKKSNNITNESERINAEINEFPGIKGLSIETENVSNKDFDITYCLNYGHWKDCKIKFNIKLPKVKKKKIIFLFFVFLINLFQIFFSQSNLKKKKGIPR